tara:strand:+ start:904 stop:1878 length:975 start_codon:yes stop_codon:yes gene_type:complete
MNKKILIYNSGGGLGDSIQLFPLILSLQNHFENHEFYYLGAHENHFSGKLKEYGIKNLNTLNLNIKYFGFRWWHILKVKKNFSDLNIGVFDLIIDLQSKLRNTLILKRIPAVKFYSATYKFNFCSNKFSFVNKENISEMTLDNLETFLNIKIRKLDYNINNLNSGYLNEAKRLLPDKGYVGFSLTQGNKYRKKSWPLDKFISLAKKIQSMNKKPVFFIDKKNNTVIEKIKSEMNGALFPEQNSSLSCPALVTALSTRLENAISIDNGIMHMIGLASIPMIVLFGPTNSRKFAPNQKNIQILDSKKMHGTKDISKIKIEDVLSFL